MPRVAAQLCRRLMIQRCCRGGLRLNVVGTCPAISRKTLHPGSKGGRDSTAPPKLVRPCVHRVAGSCAVYPRRLLIPRSYRGDLRLNGWVRAPQSLRKPFPLRISTSRRWPRLGRSTKVGATTHAQGSGAGAGRKRWWLVGEGWPIRGSGRRRGAGRRCTRRGGAARRVSSPARGSTCRWCGTRPCCRDLAPVDVPPLYEQQSAAFENLALRRQMRTQKERA